MTDTSLPVTALGPELDRVMEALAIDLVVGAAPLLVVHWVTSQEAGVVDRPLGATPAASFERLVERLDRGPVDLTLFGDKRPDGRPSFVGTFFEPGDMLPFTLDWLTPRPAPAPRAERATPVGVATLRALVCLLRADKALAPFRVYNMAHVRGELHLSHLVGTPWLQYYYVADYYILRATRLHVKMLRKCGVHELADRSLHASIHFSASRLFRSLCASRLAHEQRGVAAWYEGLGELFDALARAMSRDEAEAGFTRLAAKLDKLVTQVHDGLHERIHERLVAARGPRTRA